MKYLTHHLLQSAACTTPEADALRLGTQRISFAHMWDCVCGLASGLRNLGIGRADRVGVLLSPCPEQAIAIFGIAASGGALVPIHHSWSAQQVAHVVNDCDMKSLITTTAVWRSLAESELPLPSLQSIILVDGTIEETDRTVADYQTLIHSTSSPLDDIAIGKDLAAILYTSGSTGRPKGVMLSHANLIAGTRIVSNYLGISASDRILSVLPFTFDAGLNQLTTSIDCGGTLVMTKFLFPGEICKLLISERVTGLAGVPTFWGLLTQNKRFSESEFPDLRYITNTGGAMPLPVLEKLRARLNSTQIVLMYGLTEAFRSTYLDPKELDRRPTSMGKAIPDTEILVIDQEGNECGPDEVGELVHDGPTVSLGYWGYPELNAKVFRPHPLAPPGRDLDNRVCYSGDLVRKDEEGFLFFVGRRDNLIKTSGFRVSSTEIEDAIHADPQVAAAAVVGIPDDLLGQRIIAFVVPAECVSYDEAKTVAACATSLPAYMVPKSVYSLDQLPHTSSGKVDYKRLRQIAQEQRLTEA